MRGSGHDHRSGVARDRSVGRERTAPPPTPPTATGVKASAAMCRPTGSLRRTTSNQAPLEGHSQRCRPPSSTPYFVRADAGLVDPARRGRRIALGRAPSRGHLRDHRADPVRRRGLGLRGRGRRGSDRGAGGDTRTGVHRRRSAGGRRGGRRNAPRHPRRRTITTGQGSLYRPPPHPSIRHPPEGGPPGGGGGLGGRGVLGIDRRPGAHVPEGDRQGQAPRRRARGRVGRADPGRQRSRRPSQRFGS